MKFNHEHAEKHPRVYLKTLERSLLHAKINLKHSHSLLEQCFYEKVINDTESAIRYVNKINEAS